MLHTPTNSTKDIRGVFIIDPDNMVRAIYFYPMEVGRNTDELIRTITALQTSSKYAVATPADWRLGDDVIVPFAPKTEGNDAKAIPEGYYNLAWFMWYKKAN
jgi:peroxiredoxin (alkyl hydroperoxide reductase subunit C)